MMQKVGSREYKLMLKASRFSGSTDEFKQAAGALWSDLAAIIIPHVISISGTEDISNKRRAVRFFDTKDHWLRANDYVFRERIDLEESERKVTLKFRHPDRYISQDRNMAPDKKLDVDTKFEEDIKPPFEKLYSFSSNVILPAEHKIETVSDVKDLFPGLAKAAEDLPTDGKLQVVGGFTAFERVLKGTSFEIGKDNDGDTPAECSLTLWYKAEDSDRPEVAEFSFRYESADEDYTAGQAQRAYNVFQALQSELKGWVDLKSMTKTVYVYALAK